MEKICQQCGRKFETLQPHQKYCGFDCYDAAHHEQLRNPTFKKICKNCGREFETTHLQQKYCGKACRDAVNYVSHKALKLEIEGVTKPPEIKKSSLDDWISAAAAAGMSYGKYRAMIEMNRRK